MLGSFLEKNDRWVSPVWLAGSAAAAMLLISACGGSSGGSQSPAVSPAANGAASAALTTAYEGVAGQPPLTAPTPKAGVDVWVVSCGQAAESCNTPTAGAVEAGTALGWTVHVCDGKLNPNGWAACIRQAIAAKTHVIVPVGLDCPFVRQPLVEAKNAGITTIAAGGLDCAEVGGEKTYSGVVQSLDGMSNSDWWRAVGAMRADWIIGRTGGTAQVLELNFTDALFGPLQTEGFEKELATCGGCRVVKKLDIGNQDVIGGTLRTKFSTALLQNPSVNSVSVPVDAWFPLGLAQAITSSGRSATLDVIGAFGEIPNIGFIRDNAGQNATVAFATAQNGWAAIDATIRVLAGQPTVGEGIGYQVVDAGHNLPPAGEPYQPPVDFRAAYKKAWGLA